jgi:uncharacterized protein
MPILFDDVRSEPAVHGWLHEPERANGQAVVLTHGAGSDSQSKLLVEISDALVAKGFLVLRFDLPFRRARPHGPPFPAGASRDRAGLRRAVSVMRERRIRRVFLGGHSYGGRQASMLIAEEPELVDGLLLLSYPLHPPKKPDELRTNHFPKLRIPAFFVHGARDPFATTNEMNTALKLIPGPHAILEIEGAGHDLMARESPARVPTKVATEFEMFMKQFVAG